MRTYQLIIITLCCIGWLVLSYQACGCADRHTTETGVWLRDQGVHQEPVDDAVRAVRDAFGLDRGHIRNLHIFVEGNPFAKWGGMCCEQGVTDPIGGWVRYVHPYVCVAETTLVHELIHVVVYELEDDYDYDHKRVMYWQEESFINETLREACDA